MSTDAHRKQKHFEVQCITQAARSQQSYADNNVNTTTHKQKQKQPTCITDEENEAENVM